VNALQQHYLLAKDEEKFTWLQDYLEQTVAFDLSVE
jgi:hypothetical protein